MWWCVTGNSLVASRLPEQGDLRGPLDCAAEGDVDHLHVALGGGVIAGRSQRGCSPCSKGGGRLPALQRFFRGGGPLSAAAVVDLPSPPSFVMRPSGTDEASMVSFSLSGWRDLISRFRFLKVSLIDLFVVPEGTALLVVPAAIAGDCFDGVPRVGAPLLAGGEGRGLGGLGILGMRGDGASWPSPLTRNFCLLRTCCCCSVRGPSCAC